MDEKPKGDRVLFLPGAALARAYHMPGASARAPSQRLPAVDERLVEPETHEEMIAGKSIYALPADQDHADSQCQLGYVVRARVGEGYIASMELLTRTDDSSDFATDACVRKAGRDPATGGRFLEELSFEVASTQTLAALSKRAKRLMARGVRRLFAILVREGEVREWSPRRKTWEIVDRESTIVDKSLSSPLPIAALLDAAAADRAVAEALWAKREPFMVEIAEENRVKGRAEAILQVLALRGLELEPALRQRILTCRDIQQLDRWLAAAVGADSVDEFFAAGQAEI